MITIDSVGAIVQKVVIDASSVCIENVRAQESDGDGDLPLSLARPVRRMSFALLIATEKFVTVHHVALLQRGAGGSSSSSTLELLALDTLLTISSEQLLSGFYIESGALVGITRELQTQAPPSSLMPSPPSVLLSPTSPTGRAPSLLTSPTSASCSSTALLSAARTQQLRRCAINYATMQSQSNYCTQINSNSNGNGNNMCINSPSAASSSSICSVTRSANQVSASASTSTSPDESEQRCIVKRASLRPSISMVAVSGCDRHNPPLQLPPHLQQTSNSSLYSSLVHLYSGSVYTLLLAELLDGSGGTYANYANPYNHNYSYNYSSSSGASSSSSPLQALGAPSSSSSSASASACGRVSPAHVGAARANASSGSCAAQGPSCAAQLLFFTKYARTPVLSVPIFDRLFRCRVRLIALLDSDSDSEPLEYCTRVLVISENVMYEYSYTRTGPHESAAHDWLAVL